MEPKAAPVTSVTSDATTLFPIVGVGASAGGLAATTELVRHLGAKPELAVVIVHHLDPAHDSSLVEIFSRATELPVHAADEGMRVEPNNIYVVPPNAGLTLTEGILHLTPRIERGGLHLPIDQFFESLAADRTISAVAAVLTGSGFDGTEGVKAIKAEGGITFAQDASAEYGSMPQNAIATGCVDFVLSPQRIAEELVRIGAHPRTRPAPSSARDATVVERIMRTMQKASGVDFANYKHATILRRVQRRVYLHRLPGIDEYAELLERDPAEVSALCEDVLIHVTRFFRDPESFELLKSAVFAKLIDQRRRDSPLRVWVAGCSTGEEVYSIAIALLEVLAEKNALQIPIKIFGTDVSDSAIDKARSGRYPRNIERDVSAGRLQRFFSRTEGSGYQIRKDVRDLCIFAKQDATRDPPFAGVDLISCRNLMIYLGAALQDRVLAIFHYSLKEPGFLFLGSSETIRTFPGFVAVDPKNKIYARTSAAPRLTFDFTDRRVLDPTGAEITTGVSSPGPLDIHKEADRLVLAEFAPPGVVITDDLAIVQFRGKTGQYLEPSPGVASFDLLRMARDEYRIVLRQAIDEARASGTPARRTVTRFRPGAAQNIVEIEVIPFGVSAIQQRFFVVLFTDASRRAAQAEAAAGAAAPSEPSRLESQLREELSSTRDYLQSVIEQLEATNEELKVANEEIVSSNEELRSTNEELQTAQEELQATNEELRTINDEMNERNVEAARVNDDLQNVLSSVEIPIVIVSRDSAVRRFTRAAGTLFGLSATDIGRPLGDTKPLLRAPGLPAMMSDVLRRLGPAKCTAQDEEGRWYQVTVRPYMTADNRVDGTVITAFDIDAVTKGAELLAATQRYAESIVDTVRESLLVLDHGLRVRSANRVFQRTFGIATNDIEGRHLHELGQGEWNVPELTKMLEGLGDGDTFEDFRVEHDFPATGRRVFLLNARRIEHTALILLALEDITEREVVSTAT